LPTSSQVQISDGGLTFHGLRKSVGKDAADLGFSQNDIAGALGHSNPASARLYTIEAAREKGARRVCDTLNKERSDEGQAASQFAAATSC
jgi:integrase